MTAGMARIFIANLQPATLEQRTRLSSLPLFLFDEGYTFLESNEPLKLELLSDGNHHVFSSPPRSAKECEGLLFLERACIDTPVDQLYLLFVLNYVLVPSWYPWPSELLKCKQPVDKGAS
jgi:hypothetical protein